MRNILLTLLLGTLFGAGLTLADMVNPARILAFLDVAGEWDPTLLFVMGAALIPAALGYAVRRRMERPLLGEQFLIPDNNQLDGRLLGGAALFGVGWGLIGFCPGPAIAGLAFGAWQNGLFVAAMLGGMLIHQLATAPRARMEATA